MIDQSQGMQVSRNASLPVPEEIAIIGGGRWGKTFCKVLSDFSPQLKRVHWVSGRNSKHAQDWINHEFPDNGSVNQCHYQIWDDIQAMLNATNVPAAIVANLPADHFLTAKQLLSNNVNVLLEKPFVQSHLQAIELMRLATKNKLCLHVGHEFLISGDTHRCRLALESLNQPDQPYLGAQRVKASWCDVSTETRNGLVKQPDLTTSVAGDLYPHILSVLTTLFGKRTVELKNISIRNGGWQSCLEFIYGTLPVSLELSRVANQTDRSITIETTNDPIRMDFSMEPASITIGQTQIAQAPTSGEFLRTLNAEVAHLFLQMENPDKDFVQTGSNNQHIFEATWEAEAAVTDLQKSSLQSLILQDNIDFQSTPAKDALDGLRQHLVPTLLNTALINSPKSTDTIDEFVRLAFLVIRRVANDPFTLQHQLAEELELSVETLIQLNDAIRQCALAQDLINSKGHGSQYISNTIAPIVQSGSLEKVLSDQHQYPHRVGIYAGQSCMFHCTFCGREPNAKYNRQDVPAGNECLKQIFRDAPKDDPYRFYLSGGLEPLTNRGIGDLIETGTNEGFKLSLYTNGFMLTPSLLERQPGLWSLNSLRISLYGVDKNTTENITLKNNSFEQVVANAKTFLDARNTRNSDLKFGFNFVILRDTTEQILQLAEVLAEINRSSPSGRQIDFLTLREDYSVLPEEGISSSERKKLISIFNQFEKRLKEPDLCNLHVDYGYSLQSLKQGHIGRALEMVDYRQMIPKAYPQISVVVDLLGDVYAYREAGFLDRPGANRYILNRIDDAQSFEGVIKKFVDQKNTFIALPNDTAYFDIYDHVVTKLLNKAKADHQFGIPFDSGPIAAFKYDPDQVTVSTDIQNAHFSAEVNSEKLVEEY